MQTAMTKRNIESKRTKCRLSGQAISGDGEKKEERGGRYDILIPIPM